MHVNAAQQNFHTARIESKNFKIDVTGLQLLGTFSSNIVSPESASDGSID